MSPIKVGVVGLSAEGWASMALIKPLLSAPLSAQYTLTALSTRSAESASTAANKYSELTHHPVKPFHGDTSQIANDKDVDFVVVAVRARSQKQAALPIIEAGKNIFVEWPCGKSFQETRELWEAAKRKNVRTMVGMQGVQSPAVAKVKEWIDSGKIGRVLSTSIILNSPRELMAWGPLVSSRSNDTLDANGGSTMLAVAVGHFLGSFIPVLGDFSSVSATARTQYLTSTEMDASGKPTGKVYPQTGADQIAFSGVLKSGAVVSLHCRAGYASTKGRKPFVWVIDGEDGCIRMESDNSGGSFIHIRGPSLFLNGEEVKVGGVEDMMGNLGRAWAEFAKGEQGNYATFQDAMKVHGVLDAISKSAEQGRRVDVETF